MSTKNTQIAYLKSEQLEDESCHIFIQLEGYMIPIATVDTKEEARKIMKDFRFVKLMTLRRVTKMTDKLIHGDPAKMSMKDLELCLQWGHNILCQCLDDGLIETYVFIDRSLQPYRDELRNRY